MLLLGENYEGAERHD